MTDVNRLIALAAYPEGAPKPGDFKILEAAMPEPGPGEILVRNIYMSVDPYMRGRMTPGVKSYIPPFELGEPMEGGAVGQVVASNNDKIAAGEFVLSMLGWREYFTINGQAVQKLDASIAPLSTFLGVLGMPGLTAYAGLLHVAELKEGDNVFVSAASGAVGSVVGQIAKIKGCRVVGSAGSAEKIAYLTGELGFDAAFNYKDGKIGAAIAETCPNGIDVYFENVGGETLEAVLNNINLNARIAVCGMISLYNDGMRSPGPSNLSALIVKRATMRGFLVPDWDHLYPQFFADMGPWIAEDKVKYRETVRQGLEAASEAFIGLLAGENIGKMLVQVGDDPSK